MVVDMVTFELPRALYDLCCHGRAGFTNKLRALGVGRRVTVLLLELKLELTALGTYLEQYKAESVK